jgi:hypothetical protein
MEQVAVVLAALLALTLVAPAFAQPFADVPTDHWAYDAIAELAAKGLVEGYPDGAFRGDRAMTRYEMAMVVARLLARIEAIKIPPLPPDLVRRADLAKADAANAAARAAITKKLAIVQRLVAEFRAELAALGVRVTAVEEELAAIRARLDNTRVTGDSRMRYNVFPVGSVSGGATSRHPDVRVRARLTFTGRAGANTEAVVRLWAANNAACDNTTLVAPPSGLPTACGNYDVRYGNNYNYGVVSFDMVYVDVRNYAGAALWRVGRQFYTLTGFGPFGVGLLYDPSNSLATGTLTSASALTLGTTTTGLSDGIRADWVLGPLSITTAIFRDALLALPAAATAPAGITPGTGSGPAIDWRIVRATTGAFLPGWTLGASYVQAWQHGTCTGVNCQGGTGWGLDVSGTIMPGFTFYVDYASWASIPVVGGASLANMTAWRVGGNINLAQAAGIQQWNPNIDWAYHNFGPPAAGCPAATGCFPVHTYATTHTGQYNAFNMRGFLVRLNLTLSPAATAWVLYEGGTVQSTGLSYSEWWLRFVYTVSPRTQVTLNYFKLQTGGADTVNFYRAELLYAW